MGVCGRPTWPGRASSVSSQAHGLAAAPVGPGGPAWSSGSPQGPPPTSFWWEVRAALSVHPTRMPRWAGGRGPAVSACLAVGQEEEGAMGHVAIPAPAPGAVPWAVHGEGVPWGLGGAPRGWAPCSQAKCTSEPCACLAVPLGSSVMWSQ